MLKERKNGLTKFLCFLIYFHYRMQPDAKAWCSGWGRILPIQTFLHPKIQLRHCGSMRRTLFWKYQNLIKRSHLKSRALSSSVLQNCSSCGQAKEPSCDWRDLSQATHPEIGLLGTWNWGEIFQLISPTPKCILVLSCILK